MSAPFSTKHRMLWSRIFSVFILAYILFYHPPAILPEWVLELLEGVGFILLAVAAFGRLWCTLFIGGKKNDVLMMEGPYSIVRNPLYVFSFLAVLGFGLCVENPVLSLILTVVFFLYYSFVIRKEERFLAAAFGSVFEQYAARTPRWIPRFTLYREPETVTAVPRRFRKAMLEAMWFILAFFLWETVEILRAEGFWPKGF